ncbi:MAG TPA: hypothetical protein VGO63_01270 [Candidatus Paceibacterota bacterium]|jgi:hypothetical protein|nr:hypothetical protein [Candidatus Paceibacterota bacterium]
MIKKIKKLNIFKKELPGFPGSETWRCTKCVFYKKTSPSSTTGFAILFAVTLSAILLSIALGVANIALKEVKFGTSARSTNEAFFAGDTGIECALINDRSESDIFNSTSGATDVNCLGGKIILNGSYPYWEFTLSDLGSANQSCSKVSVSKLDDNTTDPPLTITTIIAKGYDVGDSNCDSTNPNRVEREIKTTY